MTEPDRFATAALLLGAATQLVDGIQAGVFERGFTDVRPSHGFAFVRISRGDATMVDVANHLGISKQAASQMVELLVQRGYVDRTQHPTDARSSVLSLTVKGWACARAAEDSAERTIAEWERTAGAAHMRTLTATLDAVVAPGPLRPAW
jgi:DNA-binding MarR family transcriptional regulator